MCMAGSDSAHYMSVGTSPTTAIGLPQLADLSAPLPLQRDETKAVGINSTVEVGKICGDSSNDENEYKKPPDSGQPRPEISEQNSNSQFDSPTKQVSYMHLCKLKADRSESTGSSEYDRYPIHIAALCRALQKAPMNGLLKQALGRGIKKPPAHGKKLIHLIARDMMARVNF